MDQNKIKKITPFIAAIIAVGGISFFGGMKYEQGKTPNYQNLSQTDREQMFRQGGISGNGARGMRTGTDANIPRGGAGMNATSGEVISIDDKSMTVKLRDGGSKIVFFSDKTIVLKMTEGTRGDVIIGGQVTVSGSANPDGSVTAGVIQLRSALLSVSPAPTGN